MECPNCHEDVLKTKFCANCGVNMEARKFEDVDADLKTTRTALEAKTKELDDEKAARKKDADDRAAADAAAATSGGKRKRGRIGTALLG